MMLLRKSLHRIQWWALILLAAGTSSIAVNSLNHSFPLVFSFHSFTHFIRSFISLLRSLNLPISFVHSLDSLVHFTRSFHLLIECFTSNKTCCKHLKRYYRVNCSFVHMRSTHIIKLHMMLTRVFVHMIFMFILQMKLKLSFRSNSRRDIK
jgi:hypothetical protein